jgi:photosystem II stability/assembly factor-like uncharacterized protein
MKTFRWLWIGACLASACALSNRQDERGAIRVEEPIDAQRNVAIIEAQRTRDQHVEGIRRRGITTHSVPAEWRSIGPTNISGVTMSLLTHPHNADLLFSGSYAGLWKSINRGGTWVPIEDFTGLAISALARDPNDPNVIYLGTGAGVGAGTPAALYRSDDDGAHWVTVPFWVHPACGGINSISVAPGDPKRILVGTGGPNILGCAEAGIRLTDTGGASWRTVLRSEDAYAFEGFAVFDPNVAGRAVARARKAGAYHLFYSRDAGEHWTVSEDFPDSDTNANVAYVSGVPDLVFAVHWDRGRRGTLWRSDDGGVHYRMIPTVDPLIGGNWMRCALWIAPGEPRMIVIGGIDLYRSTDGGFRFTNLTTTGALDSTSNHAPHKDVHCLVEGSDYATSGPRPLYVCTDGGIYQAKDFLAATNTSNWARLVNGHVSTTYYDIDAGPTGEIFGGMQDTGEAFTDLRGTFHLADGDGSEVHSDPADERYDYYATVYRLRRSFERGFSLVDISPGGPGVEPTVRITFAIDPNNSERIFLGHETISVTHNARDARPAWTVIRRRVDGGAWASNVSVLAVEPGDSNVVWAGLNHGLQKSENALDRAPIWRNMEDDASSGFHLSGWVTTLMIDPEHTDRVLFGSVGGDLQETIDGGLHWANRVGTPEWRLPIVPINAIARHPGHSEWLYAATAVGLYSTEDGGLKWVPSTHPVLSKVNVRDVVFIPSTNTIVVATYGRGLWMGDVPP